MSKMLYKLGFLKLRFSVEKGSKKEKLLLKIVQAENNLKHFILNILNHQKHLRNFIDNLNIKKRVTINGISFVFYDIFLSDARDGVVREMYRDEYKLNDIDFKPNDIVIDIGGNVGIVSIYLAKKYPFLKIYSFEPVKCNYDNFLENIKLNKIPDGIINVENKAITKDGRDVKMFFDRLNSGCSSIFRNTNSNSDEVLNEVPSITLDNIIKKK
ncbi:MAG: FkbM family methyltransferase [Endomicrobium sp.]|jgi:FkbM family methyltransferase|nr:FkbM family methyltransferase [Endomicrobium sp.]